jgi:hypothetical protein
MLRSSNPTLAVFQYYGLMLTRNKLLKNVQSAYHEHLKDVQSPGQIVRQVFHNDLLGYLADIEQQG